MSYTVKIGADWDDNHGVDGRTGIFGNQLGPTDVQSYSDSFLGGCESAKFTIALPGGPFVEPTVVHPLLRIGSLVQIFDGPAECWLGEITDTPNAGSGESAFVAQGLGAPLEDCAAITAQEDATTTSLAVAATAAAGRGFRLLPHRTLPSSPLWKKSEDDKQLNSLAALLAEYNLRTRNGWVVDHLGWLRIITQDSDPSWVVLPDTPPVPTAVDDYFTAVYGRYISAVDTETEPTAWGLTGRSSPAARSLIGAPRERLEDLTPHGLLTASSAGDVTEGILADNLPRTAYGAAIRLAWNQITPTAGGTVPARFSQVRPGSRLVHHGHIVNTGVVGSGDAAEWVIGHREVDVTQGTLTLAPIGLAPRTDANVRAALERLANKKTQLR